MLKRENVIVTPLACDCDTPAGLRNWRVARSRAGSVLKLIYLCFGSCSCFVFSGIN